MDFRQLRNLVFVARYASFGVAAEKLNVTQPALSKSIRTLEQSTGVRLLDRGPWGVRPTDFGVRLIEYGEAILALSDEAQDELEALRGAQRGRLRVGGIATMVRTLLPEASRRFLARHPAVNLTLNEELSQALQNQLLNGMIDIALMSRPRSFPDEELEYRDLLQVPIRIVADRNHPLAARDNISLAELTEWLWIIPARPDPDRTALDGLFAAAGLPLPNAICETTSSTFQVSMQTGSPWLSYLSSASASFGGPQGKIVPLRLNVPTWNRSIGIVHRRHRVHRPLLASFIRELDQLAQEMNAAAQG
ncbi:LysR family transcriptional regulator [Phaeovulum sp. W22_SRMD_FR3]|uniref:LysR family transcriptional regulator n=1 Tax=Phaeovulum sp. W22_SRMD_FR3 TaxID=3240274 RepID=UPI003F96624A